MYYITDEQYKAACKVGFCRCGDSKCVCDIDHPPDVFYFIDWFAKHKNIHLKIDKAHFNNQYSQHYSIQAYELVEDGTTSYGIPNYKREGVISGTAGAKTYYEALLDGVWQIIIVAKERRVS